MIIVPDIYAIKTLVSHQYLLIDQNELTLIDTGLPGNSNRIARLIRDLGYPLSALKNILITHADGDHAGAIGELKRLTGATIYASAIEADAIRAGKSSRELKLRGLRKAATPFLKWFIPNTKNPVDEILKQGDVLPILGGLEVVETPGHTPGHISFYLKSRAVCFAGDSVWVKSKKLIPVASEANTWDKAMAVVSFEKQLSLMPEFVAAGHALFRMEK